MDEFVDGGVGDMIADVPWSRMCLRASERSLYVAPLKSLGLRGQALV